MIDPLGSSRALAVAALLRADGGEPLDSALDHALRGRPADAAGRATALACSTLRLRNRCDFILEPLLHRPLARSAPVLRAVLRVGAYELLWSPRVTAEAAVDNLVSVARGQGNDAVARATNAVLRRVSAAADDLRLAPAALSASHDLLGHLVHWLSLPGWLAQRWLDTFGREKTLGLAAAALAEPRLALRVNTRCVSREQALTALTAAGVAVEPSPISPVGLLLERAGAPHKLLGWDAGWFSVQDEAAQCLAPLTGIVPGQRVIELCAAPGGKATHLAELLDDRGEVLAFDDDAGRLAPLLLAAERLGLSCVTAQVADGRGLAGKVEPADAVLLDAPCTGTGTLARRPDLRWRLRPQRLAGAVALQRELLAAAALLVRPGGVIVYSTCSLEPEENERQLAWLAGAHPELQPDGDVAQPPPGWDARTASVTILPAAGRHDGFFVARRRKRG